MHPPHLIACLLAFALLGAAGFADLSYSSPQSGMRVYQGDVVTLELSMQNGGLSEGNAAYISSVTLIPGACINGGQSITLEGGLVCPDSPVDYGCAFRFRNATQRDVYTFSNLTTDADCADGQYSYGFIVAGNSEVGGGGSFSGSPRNATPAFSFAFIGPHFCGDGSCNAWEDCTSCPADCSRCKECFDSERSCAGDSLRVCAGGFWEDTYCSAGCGVMEAGGEPACLPSCSTTERRCVSANTLVVCSNSKWGNVSCPGGCVYDRCRGNCASVGCPEACAGAVHRSNGTCSPITGECAYSEEPCPNGCSGNTCAAPVPAAGFNVISLLALAIGALAVIAIAALAFFRFRRR